MITAPPGVRVLVWPAPVDFRRGMDSLAALVQVTLRLDPFAGDVFVFRSRRPDRVKLLVYDGTGLILITNVTMTADNTLYHDVDQPAVLPLKINFKPTASSQAP